MPQFDADETTELAYESLPVSAGMRRLGGYMNRMSIIKNIVFKEPKKKNFFGVTL